MEDGDPERDDRQSPLCGCVSTDGLFVSVDWKPRLHPWSFSQIHSAGSPSPCPPPLFKSLFCLLE